jgi:hypothetical protein
MFVTAFEQIGRFDGATDVDDELQVAVFGINPCVNEYFLGAATVQNPDYSQSSVNRAVVRETVNVVPIYGEGGAGVVDINLVFNGTGEVFVSKSHSNEMYPGFLSIQNSRGTSRAATVSGSVTFNNEPATLVDFAYLNLTRAGALIVQRTTP